MGADIAAVVGTAGSGVGGGIAASPEAGTETATATATELRTETAGATITKRSRRQLIDAALVHGIVANAACMNLLKLIADRRLLSLYQMYILFYLAGAVVADSPTSIPPPRQAKSSYRRLQRYLAQLTSAGFVGSHNIINPHPGHLAARSHYCKLWYVTQDGEAYLAIKYEGHKADHVLPTAQANHTYGINAALTGLLAAVVDQTPATTASASFTRPASPMRPLVVQYEDLGWQIKPEGNKAAYQPDQTGRFILQKPLILEETLNDARIWPTLKPPEPTRQSVPDTYVPGQFFAQKEKITPYLYPESGFSTKPDGEMVWPFFVEYDRATERAARFAEKVKALTYLYNNRFRWPSEWQNRFPTVLVITEGNNRYMGKLLTRTRITLNNLKKIYRDNLPSSWWFATHEAFHLIYPTHEAAYKKPQFPAQSPTSQGMRHRANAASSGLGEMDASYF